MQLETYDTTPQQSQAEILREAKYNYRKEQAKEVLKKAGSLIKKGASNIAKGAKQTYKEVSPKIQAAIKKYQEKKAEEAAYRKANPQIQKPSQGQSFISHGQNQLNATLGMGGMGQNGNPFGGNSNPFGAIVGNPMGQAAPMRRKKGRKVRYQEPYNPFKMI
jgi:hypothetical protein